MLHPNVNLLGWHSAWYPAFPELAELDKNEEKRNF